MPDPAIRGRLQSFRSGVGLQLVIERLSKASVSYSRYSTTVSYFPDSEDQNRLMSYELHASYTGRSSADGDPEVEKSYFRNSYRIIRSSEGLRWVAESTGEQISEADFYSMLIYSSPSRVINLQQLSFELGGAEHFVELNLEGELLVMNSVGDESRSVPALLADLIEDEELAQTDYLSALLHSN